MKARLSLLFISIALTSFSQLEDINPTSRYRTHVEAPNNVERYGIDYELKDYTFINGDSTILSQLNLEALEEFRSEDESVEAIDSNTGLIVILYQEKRNNTPNSLNLNE